MRGYRYTGHHSRYIINYNLRFLSAKYPYRCSIIVNGKTIELRIIYESNSLAKASFDVILYLRIFSYQVFVFKLLSTSRKLYLVFPTALHGDPRMFMVVHSFLNYLKL